MPSATLGAEHREHHARPAYAPATPRPGAAARRARRPLVTPLLTLLLGLLLATALLPATPAAATSTTTPAATPGAASHGPAGRVALVGVPGLQWSDFSESGTPTLWKLVTQGGSASLSTRAVPPPDRGITCPMAGWLTISAGQRAGTPGRGCPSPQSPRPAGEGATVPGWQDLVAFQSDTGYAAQLGTLGQLVTDSGGKVAAIGPGAALAAADKTGKIAKYAPTLDTLNDLTPYNLIVFEAADLATAWAHTPLDEYGIPTSLPAPERQAAATRADQQIAALVGKLPPNTTLLLAGISDISPNAHLHAAIATGPSPNGQPYPHGYLTASSTRQDGLVTITDLTATAIQLLGLTAPQGVVGRPWQPDGNAPASAAGTVTRLADGDLASQVLKDVRGPFFTVLVSVQLLFYAFAALALRRRSARVPETPSTGDDTPSTPSSEDDHPGTPATTSPTGETPPDERAPTPPPAPPSTPPPSGAPADASRLLVAVQVVATVSGAIAVSTFLAQLVPWWSLPMPMVSVIVTILAIAALITALAFAGPWRSHVLGPLTVVASITSLALLIDVMTGSALQVNAVTGYEPVTGGRFYGFSNIAFAVYATGTILGLAGVAQWLLGRGVSRTVVVTLCALYAAFAVFADGSPSWGADFGGVPAFVIGAAVFLILLSGKRVSVLKLLLVGVVAVVLIAGISVFDWMRPADRRTHLGTFVQQVIDGQAWTVVGRKLTAMIGVTVGNWSLTLLSLVALAFLFLVLARPSRWGASALGQAYALAPPLRAGLFGTLTCAFIGFLMNDSGIAIPAMALTVAVPLTLAACVRALQLATPTPSEQRSTPAAPTRSEA
ncbi:hypothetical protein ACFFV7_12590 [Nonomuraea spiralis]|uniref:Uncharacterized protein n=1 Tax=Nonomuraea spiralis TaxID=46182 RepID=A0ABV5IBZ5_9ACTN|nr:hypothetical protein [Nonomuraea spiralis]GGS79425.1 hypothetical protein GCM10010176_023410 [Nonomuraea spiralis]